MIRQLNPEDGSSIPHIVRELRLAGLAPLAASGFYDAEWQGWIFRIGETHRLIRHRGCWTLLGSIPGEARAKLRCEKDRLWGIGAETTAWLLDEFEQLAEVVRTSLMPQQAAG